MKWVQKQLRGLVGVSKWIGNLVRVVLVVCDDVNGLSSACLARRRHRSGLSPAVTVQETWSLQPPGLLNHQISQKMATLRRSASVSSLSSLQRAADFPPLPLKKEIKRESPAPFPLALDAPINAERVPENYVSLPATPVSRSPPNPEPRPRYASDVSTGPVPFSLWDYLREELLATDFDSHQEMKWERVSNFLHVPLAVEKVCLRYLVLYLYN